MRKLKLALGCSSGWAEFKQANPSVELAVAHDAPAMERRFSGGAIGRGFN